MVTIEELEAAVNAAEKKAESFRQHHVKSRDRRDRWFYEKALEEWRAAYQAWEEANQAQ